MDDTYFLHQTPFSCAKDLLALVPLVEGDRVIEAFKGEGAFYDQLPSFVQKDWAEITQGRDYASLTHDYDWVITNPPFRLEHEGKRVNSFWYLLDYYSTRAHKGIAFLANDKCFSTLTPRRLELLQQRGWGFTSITVCSVKKWRGRYFFIVLEKNKPSVLASLSPNYD